MYLLGVLLLAFGITITIVGSKNEAAKGFATGCIIFPILFFGICVIIGAIVWNSSKEPPSVDNSFYNQTAPPSENSACITLEEFNKLKNGMTYEQCAELIGGLGTLTSSSSIGNSTFDYYTWEGTTSFSTASLIFDNNHLYSKTQFGLK